MIVYNENFDQRFSDFGILIPIVDDRSKKVAKALNIDSTKEDHFIDLTKEDLLRVHNIEFVEELFNENLEKRILEAYELIDSEGNYHRFEPSSAKEPLSVLRDRILKQASATLYSCEKALDSGWSYFLGGGMHHAMSFGGRGFCLVNDMVIAIRNLQSRGLIKTAWIIDVDAHKGDGSAEICQSDDSIKTLSIHMKEGWPLDSGSENDPWFIGSDIDIEIAFEEEGSYLERLKAGIESLLKTGLPDLCIVVNGSDPYELDGLESSGLLKLSKEQMLKRDRLVYEFLLKEKIPQTYVMAGGYGDFASEIYEQFLRTLP